MFVDCREGRDADSIRDLTECGSSTIGLDVLLDEVNNLSLAFV